MDFWYLPDEPNLVSSARRWSTNLLSLLGEPVTFSLHPEDAEPFLHRLGFRLRELADAETLRRRYFNAQTHLYPTNYLVHAVVDDDPTAQSDRGKADAMAFPASRACSPGVASVENGALANARTQTDADLEGSVRASAHAVRH